MKRILMAITAVIMLTMYFAAPASAEVRNIEGYTLYVTAADCQQPRGWKTLMSTDGKSVYVKFYADGRVGFSVWSATRDVCSNILPPPSKAGRGFSGPSLKDSQDASDAMEPGETRGSTGTTDTGGSTGISAISG